MHEDTYHLAQNGQNTGPFTLEQARAMWRSGTLSPQTLYWTPGQADWQPLAQLAATLAAPPALPGSPPVPVPVAGVDYLTRTTFANPVATSGVAIASFVLGLASLFLSIFTAIPAVICGHMALSQIDRSGGRLGGRGFAMTGLILGYVFVVILALAFVVGLGAGILLPILNATHSRSSAAADLARGKQVVLAIKLYEGDHDERTPPDLDSLIPTYLPDRSLLTHHTGSGDDGPTYDYLLPNTKTEGMDEHTPVLRARFASMGQRRVYVYLDDSAELKL